jgi:HD superfamily phosphohydrolase YqeK
MYEQIIKDPIFINIMNEIGNIKFIEDGKWDWEHSTGHAIRVSSYVEQILMYLGEDDKTIEIGKVAGILHDIGLISGVKKGHAVYGSKLARDYLEKCLYDKHDLEIIVQAISDHSSGKNICNNIGVALMLADKIDVSRYRVLNSSISDEINNQIANIKDVKIIITEKKLIVNYLTNGIFDPLILKHWNKSILGPLKAARYLKKEYVFKIDDTIYDYSKILRI